MRFIEIAAVACLVFPLAGPAFAQGGLPAEGVRAGTSGSSMGMRKSGMQKKMIKPSSKMMMLKRKSNRM